MSLVATYMVEGTESLISEFFVFIVSVQILFILMTMHVYVFVDD